MAISLADLVAALPHGPQLHGAPAELRKIPIEAISCDSRQVAAGSLFVAYCGVSVDGHDFAPQAVANGAAAIVAERHLDGLGVPLVVVPDGRQALAHLSAAWYGFPSHQLTVVGVTGNDGKQSTCNPLHSVLK